MTAERPGNNLRRRVLRMHGTALFVLTTVNLGVITWGYTDARGYYAMLHEQPMGFAGLWQAYGIMFAVGVALWFGSSTAQPRWFDLVGALAHVPILFALIAFPETYAGAMGGYLALASAPIHGVFIVVELFAFFWLGSFAATIRPDPGASSSAAADTAVSR